jgi:poly(hydroxyalkanoate) depolymerase family esterase
VLFPEQQRGNNPNSCFNWFLPLHAQRNHGEVLSVRQMIEQMILDHGIDRRRVFIVGLSAGGVMTSATRIRRRGHHRGLPYGSAGNVQEAFEFMAQGDDRLKSGGTLSGTLLPTAGHGREFHCGMAWHR